MRNKYLQNGVRISLSIIATFSEEIHEFIDGKLSDILRLEL